jgi:hypothetical protein
MHALIGVIWKIKKIINIYIKIRQKPVFSLEFSLTTPKKYDILRVAKLYCKEYPMIQMQNHIEQLQQNVASVTFEIDSYGNLILFFEDKDDAAFINTLLSKVFALEGFVTEPVEDELDKFGYDEDGNEFIPSLVCTKFDFILSGSLGLLLKAGYLDEEEIHQVFNL